MPLGVYAASLSGAPAYWDTGEAQTVPWIFGIMHPTGFPAFTILAGVFAHAVPIGPVSWRIALFSALAMSGVAWLVSRIVCELRGDAWIASAAACVFAFGDVAWTRGTRAEVHALAAWFGVLALYAAIRWYRRGERKALILAAFAWGMGIATHPVAALLLPAFAVLFFARARSVTMHALAFAILALLAGVAWYGYLPARSAAVTSARLDPTRQLGIPPGQAFWDNDHPASWSGFKKVVTGEEFKAGGTFARMLDPQTYLDGGDAYGELLLREFTPLGLLLALGGLYGLARRDVWFAAAAFLAIALPSAFAVAYSIETDPQRYFLIPFALLAALGGYAASEISRELPPLRIAATLLTAALAFVLLGVNIRTFDQRTESGARAVIATAIEKTPPDAILLAPWVYAAPLAYGAYVERRLGHRIVVSAWLSQNAKRVPRWTRSRPVFVVGRLFGEVPGFRAVKIPAPVPLYRITKQ